MTFFDAKERYRTRAGDQFRQPDMWKSKKAGDVWRLRDSQGRPVAIVSSDGRVLCAGTYQTGGKA